MTKSNILTRGSDPTVTSSGHATLPGLRAASSVPPGMQGKVMVEFALSLSPTFPEGPPVSLNSAPERLHPSQGGEELLGTFSLPLPALTEVEGDHPKQRERPSPSLEWGKCKQHDGNHMHALLG